MPIEKALAAMLPQEVFEVLGDADQKTAFSLHELGMALGCKVEVKIGARANKVVYSLPAPKKRALFTIECSPAAWRVKANLFRIGAYEAHVQESSETIRASIKATRACVQCNPGCRGRASYVIDGETLLPCYGGGHYFKALEENDWNRLQELIALESKA